MSDLKIYRPRESEPARDGVGHHESANDEPEVLSFAMYADRVNRFRSLDVITRARFIHENRQCPYCHDPVVAPVELLDAILNRNNMPIPGTATLVGFRCDRCRSEWPVADRAVI